MFFDNQTVEEQNKYELLLRIIGALSKLSNDSSSIPYLYYRMAENIFCRAFAAKNLARSDISVDASKLDIGIGLKTFIHRNGHCLEKVAEFNKKRVLYKDSKNTDELIIKVARFRNDRITAACGICSLPKDKLIYHCVTRADSIFYLHEEPMHLIDIDKINIELVRNNTISFNDGIEEYCFNISKSTLYKRFNINPLYTVKVKIFDDPFELLERYLSDKFQEDTSNKIIDTLYLPLYSYDRKTKEPVIPLRSGLNQWNANGRTRNINEVYIPYPAEVKNCKKDFFPPKDTSFTLHLPNGTFKMAKICQANDKALMTNPNEDLGKWILRDVLNLKEGELATYDKLVAIGIDTVQINKFEDGTYEINFKGLGTYEAYKQQELLSLI